MFIQCLYSYFTADTNINCNRFGNTGCEERCEITKDSIHRLVITLQSTNYLTIN